MPAEPSPGDIFPAVAACTRYPRGFHYHPAGHRIDEAKKSRHFPAPNLDRMPDAKLSSLLQRFGQRDRLALARLITLVENRSAEVSDVMEQIYGRLGNAYIVGITGAP